MRAARDRAASAGVRLNGGRRNLRAPPGVDRRMTASPARQRVNQCQEIDRRVGARIRARRILLGLTQQQLAELIGVTYQQAHKYERAINRISAGRLYEIARVLNLPVSHFFEDADGTPGRPESARERMCLELARNFTQIANERHQEAVSRLARALADGD
jgi:transcriptional regulator with XRE-family HTH domain